MAEKSFIPSTAQFKIPRTCYQVQLGTVNDKWATNLLKENRVITSYIYKDEELGEFGLPNPSDIVKWFLSIIPTSNVHKFTFMRTVKTLIEQTILKKLYPKAGMPISKSFYDMLYGKLDKLPENELTDSELIERVQKIKPKIGEKQRITKELEQLLNDPNVDIDFRLRFLIDNAFLSFQFLFVEKYESEWYELAQTYIDFLKSKNKLENEE